MSDHNCNACLPSSCVVPRVLQKRHCVLFCFVPSLCDMSTLTEAEEDLDGIDPDNPWHSAVPKPKPMFAYGIIAPSQLATTREFFLAAIAACASPAHSPALASPRGCKKYSSDVTLCHNDGALSVSSAAPSSVCLQRWGMGIRHETSKWVKLCNEQTRMGHLLTI